MRRRKYLALMLSAVLSVGTLSNDIKCFAAESKIETKDETYLKSISLQNVDDSVAASSGAVTQEPDDTGNLEDGDFLYEIKNGNLYLKSYSGQDEDVVVPSKVQDFNVKGVLADAFKNNVSIKTITFSEGIETVKDINFCPNLTTINFPASFTDGIDENGNLNSESFSMFTIQNCESVENINVADGNNYVQVKDGVLYSKDMKYLLYYPAAKTDKDYNVENGTQILAHGSFQCNKYIEKIALPETVTEIQNCAFWQCSVLEKLNIPKLCNKIGEYLTFTGDKNLKEITVDEENDTYRVVDEMLCSNDTVLVYFKKSEKTDVHIPSGIKNIGAYAFEDADNISNVYMPESVEVLGEQSFKYSNIKENLNLYIVGKLPQTQKTFSGISNVNVYQDINSDYKWSEADKSVFENANVDTKFNWLVFGDAEMTKSPSAAVTTPPANDIKPTVNPSADATNSPSGEATPPTNEATPTESPTADATKSPSGEATPPANDIKPTVNPSVDATETPDDADATEAPEETEEPQETGEPSDSDEEVPDDDTDDEESQAEITLAKDKIVLAAGKSTTIKYEAYDDDGGQSVVTAVSASKKNVAVSVTSADKIKITVPKSAVKGEKVKVTVKCGQAEKILYVTVANGAKSVKALKSTVTTKKGKKLKTTFIVKAENSKKAMTDVLKISSSNKNIVKPISKKKSGEKYIVTIQAVKKGTAKLKLTIGKKSAQVKIKVK